MNNTHVSAHIQFAFSSLLTRELLARKNISRKAVLSRILLWLPPELHRYLSSQTTPHSSRNKTRGCDASRDRIHQEVPRALTSCLFNDCWGLSMLWRLFVNANKSEQFWATTPATHALLLREERREVMHLLRMRQRHPWLGWIQGSSHWSPEDG